MLLVMLALEPEQGKEIDTYNIGFSFILQSRGHQCYHLRHWVLSLVFVLVVVSSSACASAGVWWPLYGALGIAKGMAASDLKYTDAFRFLVPCTVTPTAPQ